MIDGRAKVSLIVVVPLEKKMFAADSLFPLSIAIGLCSAFFGASLQVVVTWALFFEPPFDLVMECERKMTSTFHLGQRMFTFGDETCEHALAGKNS